MLVLTRRREESIIIGNDIEIKIVDVQGEQVKLGISAPKTVPVNRKEIWLAISQENQAALDAHPPAALPSVGKPAAVPLKNRLKK